MTLSAWPFADVDTTEAQYGALFALLQSDGLKGVPGDSSGAVAPVSGLVVRANPFPFAYLAGVVVTSDAAVNVTLDAASSSDRIDRVVVRISGGNAVSVGVLKGAPGAGAPAALTQVPGDVYEISLARVLVQANTTTIATGNITDERPWLGTPVGNWTTGTRPGTTGQRAARKGEIGYNHTTGSFERWDGTAWGPVGSSTTTTTTTGPVIKVWNGTAYTTVTGTVYIGTGAPPGATTGIDAWVQG